MMGIIRNTEGADAMVRYAADHKAKTRALIVEATAERIAAGGFGAAGVASIMAEAGLTHGGFYAHFPSRDALLAAAVERLFARGVETLDRIEDKHGERALGRYLDFYLSARHRDDAAGGCPIPALAAEARHAAPLAELAGVVTLARAIEDARISGELLAGKRKALASV
jgi:TetR/AcrR family transcriptional repressor of nem operon